ncbi:MAG: FtsB family cell division protein [Holosporales bacterium]|jgi:cell division protein FtsB
MSYSVTLKDKRDAATKRRRLFLLVLAVLLLLYFTWHLITGHRGLMAWRQVDISLSQASATLAILNAEEKSLEHRARLLRRDNLDLDMVEEQARHSLGYMEPDEKIILLKEEP